jgi:hypothetical protein
MHSRSSGLAQAEHRVKEGLETSEARRWRGRQGCSEHHLSIFSQLLYFMELVNI